MYKGLEDLIQDEINRLGFELIGLELEGQGHSKLLRVYIDISNQGVNGISDLNISQLRSGITIEDCSKVNRHLNRFISTLDELNFNRYTLEVSSPGVERKLFNLAQFDRQLGQQVKLSLKIPLDGRSNFIGILKKVDLKLNQIFMEVEKQQICVDYDNIAKANLVYSKNR